MVNLVKVVSSADDAIASGFKTFTLESLSCRSTELTFIDLPNFKLSKSAFVSVVCEDNPNLRSLAFTFINSLPDLNSTYLVDSLIVNLACSTELDITPALLL